MYDPAILDGLFTSQSNSPGTLIAVCGFDGSGKTTQINLIANNLREKGLEVVVTRQPTDWYRNIPNVRHFLDSGIGMNNIKAIALLAAADKLFHVANVIEPALRRGAVVITDRYVYSTIALFIHRGLSFDFLVEINKGIRRPDFSIYLDVPTRVLLERLRQRDGANLKHEERSEEVVDAIKNEFYKFRNILSIIDGSKDKHSVFQSILQICGQPSI